MFTLRSIIAVTIVIGLFGVERPVSAQQIEVRALVDETTIGDQDIVNSAIQINGADLNGVETPSAPSAEGLALMQRTPSTQQSMTIINGQLEQSISFGWRYQPVRRGNARIDAATVTVNGRTYTTEAISINVVDQVQRPRRPSPSGRQGWPFVVPSRPHADARRDIDSRDLFIRAVPSKRTARQNEQITIEYRLYFRDGIQLRHSRLTGSWDAEGFWREEFEIDTRPVPTSVVENGLLYHMIVLKRVAVFPTRPGTLTVDPLEIETEAYFPSGGGDPFERFFSLGNRFDTVQLSSDSVELIVQPLPPGAPSSFSGAVGDYRMRASLSATSVEVGEPVEVRIVIEGEGNVATLEAPRFEPAGVFERYDPNVGTSVRRDGRRISGRKSFTFVLVPRSNGEFEMPPVEFTFYHPERSDYVTITSELPELEVTGTAAPLAAGTTSAGLPVDDIAGIITDASSWRRIGERPLYRRVWPYAAVATP